MPGWVSLVAYLPSLPRTPQKPITCQPLLENKYVGKDLGLVLKLLSENTNVTRVLIGRANKNKNLFIYATMQKHESTKEIR